MPNDTFSVVLPTNTGGGAYATAVNDAIQEIRDKLAPRVPSSAINIDATLDCNNQALEDLRRLTLTAQGSVATNLSIYVIGNDFYCRDGAGNEIRLTSAGVLNAATDLNGAHGSRFIQAPAHLGGINTGAAQYFSNGKGVGSAAGATTFHMNIPPLRRGDRIRSVTARVDRGAVAGTTQIQLYRVANPIVSVGGPASSAATAGLVDVTISGLSIVVGTHESYTLLVTLPVSQDSLQTVTVEYDRP